MQGDRRSGCRRSGSRNKGTFFVKGRDGLDRRDRIVNSPVLALLSTSGLTVCVPATPALGPSGPIDIPVDWKVYGPYTRARDLSRT